MLNLKQIQLNNFLSHKKTKIPFKENQKLLIDGVSGSGKSSIVDAILWSIYGKSRSDNRFLIRKEAKKAEVILELGEYKITRSVTDKNKHELTVHKNDELIETLGIKETQAYIEQEIVHSSYLLFINSILYPQDTVDSFVKQTALKRKEIVLEIINASSYDGYYKKAKDSLNEYKTSLEIENTKINTLKSNIGSEDEYINQIDDLHNKEEQNELEQKELINKINNLKLSKSELEDVLNSCNEIKEAHNDLSKSIKEKELNINEIVGVISDYNSIDINEINQKIKELEDTRKHLKDLNDVKDIAVDWSKAYAGLTAQRVPVKDYDFEIDEINKELISAINEEIEKCPKCATPYPSFEERKEAKIKSLEEKLIKKEEDKKYYETRVDICAQKISALGESPKVDYVGITKLTSEIELLGVYEKQLIEYNSKKGLIKNYEDSLNKLSKEITKEKHELEKIKIPDNSEVNKQIFDINNIISENENKLYYLNQEGRSIHGKLMIAERAKKTKEEIELKVKEIKKKIKKIEDDCYSLKLIKEAFGNNGIRALMVDYIIPKLEEKINEILSKMSDFSIRLETQKSGSGKDVVIEGLFINIINEQGEIFEYSNYSGGEKMKISYAIFEALASISKCNFRILDEVFVGLDNDSIEGFISVMNLLQKDVAQILCITHLENIKNLFEEKLLIVKTNGSSHVRTN